MLEKLKEELWKLHLELPKNKLVSWTSGNISARDEITNLVVIKPSGILYEDLSPDKLVVLDLNGRVIEGSLKPSTDSASHLYIYRSRPDIKGIVHTHSAYATSFAAVGRHIPVALTAIADEFGGSIPCSSYASIGGEQIGKEVINCLGKGKAVLLRQHGVFTVGESPLAALKTAVMLENIAKTIYLAERLGKLEEIKKEEVNRAHQYYVQNYG